MSASKQEYNRKRRRERTWDPDKVLDALCRLQQLGHDEIVAHKMLHQMAHTGFLLPDKMQVKKTKKVHLRAKQGVRVRGTGKLNRRPPARPTLI